MSPPKLGEQILAMKTKPSSMPKIALYCLRQMDYI